MPRKYQKETIKKIDKLIEELKKLKQVARKEFKDQYDKAWNKGKKKTKN